MTRGISKTLVFDARNVADNNASNWSFIYTTSLVKDPRWNLGDKVVLPDGRAFRYSKSAAACLPTRGAESTLLGYTAYTVLAVSASAGDTSFTVPAATHAPLAEDELRGGYVIIWNDADSQSEFRQILGNTAAAANAAFVVYLDGPLSANLVAATAACETYKSPYASMQTGTSVALSKLGVPAVYVSAANTYFWLQVAGPRFCDPQASLTGKERGFAWRHDGSIDDLDNGIEDDASVASVVGGHLITGTADGNGPLIMLQE